MNTYGISQRSYALLLNAFRVYPEISKVFLFGSRAKGNYKNGSDIDLAVMGEKLTPALIFQLKCELNERLPIPYYVDVIDYEHLSASDIKAHIDRVGKLIYAHE